MRSSSRIPPERCVVLTAVIAVHLLLFLLRSKLHSNLRETVESGLPNLQMTQWVNPIRAPVPAVAESNPTPLNERQLRMHRPPDMPIETPSVPIMDSPVTESPQQNPP